ncbi:MAG: DNA translocase FtsK, partial [Chloroflexota bacterium]
SIVVGASALFGKLSGRREEPAWQPEMTSGAGDSWAARGDLEEDDDFSGRPFGSPSGYAGDERASGVRPRPPLAGRSDYPDYGSDEDDFEFAPTAESGDDRREAALPARAGEHYVEYGGHYLGAEEDADASPPYYPAAGNGGQDDVRHVTGEVERPEENGDVFYSGYGPRGEGDPSERQSAAMEDGEMAAPLPYFMQIPRFPWPLPGINLLKTAPPGNVPQSEIDATSQLIVDTLAQHGIDVSIGEARVGPRVTMYGVVPGWGQGRSGRGNNGQEAAQQDGRRNGKRVRVDTILNREKDLALALASPSLRFEAPVPGASLVGIEVPNSKPSQVTLRTVMDSEAFRSFVKEAPLPVPLGVGSGGEPVMMDLTRMPHVLVAGATGSGKSVCMNTIATSLLMTRKPSEVRMVMVDPKRVELTPYAEVPHLATPPIVEAEDAVAILKAAVEEMMLRFKVLESAGARNIAAYNQRAVTKMPYLVIMVDELADLMVTSAHEVERLLCRLAQLGRATGIHLVVATQRPSVDVVTGLIKANFPSRISFNVMSQVDSRTILDSAGAEKLLGKGDMLYLPVDLAKALRVQGGFLSDTEIEAVVRFWKKTDGPQLPQLEPLEDAEGAGGYFEGGGNGDSLFDRAVDLAGQHKTLSVSLLQRRLRIGYPRAARLMDELTEEGIVGEGEPGKPRPVLIGSGS